MKKIILASLICLLSGTALIAQAPVPTAPRQEDHFWRRKVVNRIDLTEKMNEPLVRKESNFYTDNSTFSEKNGLIEALMNGLKHGKFVAYDPDSLSKQLSYEDVMQVVAEIEGEGYEEDEFDNSGDEGDFEDFGGEGDEEDFFAEDEGFEDEFGDEFGEDLSNEDDLGDAAFAAEQFDFAPFENVIHFVEDRIFDRTRSSMVYDIQYLQVIWTDPGETLPERPICNFAYKDIIESLEGTQWKNRFNDAEYKNLREVFELRLFNSIIVDVSGNGVNNLQEAESRRQQLVEFEHHLWSY